MRYEIRLSGEGGQGIILAALILAESIGVYGINYVVQSQSYGPEARGGASKAEVIVDDDKIDYQKAIKPDLLLAMNQASCNAYYRELKSGGILIVDSSKVERIPTTEAIAIPFTRMAREEFQKPFVANMIALGSIAKVCDAVDLENLKKAVADRVPKGTADLNLKALMLGVGAVK